MSSLTILEHDRDVLIKKLWVVFRKMSDIQGLEMTDEDVNLWSLVTNHSGCQKVWDKSISGTLEAQKKLTNLFPLQHRILIRTALG